MSVYGVCTRPQATQPPFTHSPTPPIKTYQNSDEEGATPAAALPSSSSSTGGETGGLNDAEDALLDADDGALPVPLSHVSERGEMAMASLRATLDDLD